ncbi:MAG: aldo/keto reductase [Acidimicrobiaceae bacterium]|jgi:aryl-alcohol dehydrogenase-like predicted oxidoreductase|nr:aldo/keto reductase [Acidimicrobiaceae bacterium]
MMRYRTLGATGMNVSTYCLGAMAFGAWGNQDHDECIRIVHEALGSGINFIDTADVYSQGESEIIVGKALKDRRDDVILATKANKQIGEGINHSGNSRRWIVHEVEASLTRLGTDWIDLYQMHRPDPSTDIEETLAALTDLQHQGKIRAFGSSTFPADLIVEAQWVSERRGLGRFRCEQPPYSLLVRGIERSVLPACHRYGLGVFVWFPLANGWLSGDVSTRVDPSSADNMLKVDRVNALIALAKELGVPLPHLAMAFAVAHPAVTAAVIGPSTMTELRETFDGASFELDDATLDRLDEIVAPGADVSAADAGWQPPAITESVLRRRPLAERAAS